MVVPILMQPWVEWEVWVVWGAWGACPVCHLVWDLVTQHRYDNDTDTDTLLGSVVSCCDMHLRKS